MSNEGFSTTSGDDAAPLSSREFTKMDLDIHQFLNDPTRPPTDTMKVEINTEWDPSGNLGDFPRNIKRIVWAHRENGEQFIGMELTNTAFVYIRVQEETEEYLVVPLGDEEGLDFFTPQVLRRNQPVEDFCFDEGIFDLADEV
jgi:hypothetical protein